MSTQMKKNKKVLKGDQNAPRKMRKANFGQASAKGGKGRSARIFSKGIWKKDGNEILDLV